MRVSVVLFFRGLLALAVLCAAPVVEARDGARKVIIDDDGFGMLHLLMLESPEVEILGLTTVTGDTWRTQTSAMVLRGLEAAGRPSIPVMDGALDPLVNSPVRTERWEALYGKLAWKGAWTQGSPGPEQPLPWGQPRLKPSPEVAANFLIRMVHRYPGEVTILAGGPMTNLALAQKLDPAFAGLARELVYMGGSFSPRRIFEDDAARSYAAEFENTPRREFNMAFDPEAASAVLHAPWRKIVAVPVDPSTATRLSEDFKRCIAAHAPAGIARIVAEWPTGLPLWDAIAGAVWLDPTLALRREDLFVDVNTAFDAGYGDTLSWHAENRPGAGEQVNQVVLQIDPARFDALLAERACQGFSR